MKKMKRSDEFTQNKSRIWLVVVIMIGLSAIGLNQLFAKTKQDATLAMLQKYDLDDLTIEEIVFQLDSVIDEPSTLMAGISGTELMMYDKNKEYKLNLPDDIFYLSFAPYEHNTHPCTKHNLTTCRGEMVNQDFEVIVTDRDGKEILNATMTSMDNGFIGIWLPRNIEANLNVKHGSKTANYDITTYKDSDTCLTTPLKLA